MFTKMYLFMALKFKCCFENTTKLKKLKKLYNSGVKKLEDSMSLEKVIKNVRKTKLWMK